ncbi:MAG: hypothetical protein HONBIEJF_00584 [Fimbriimonadaceae bacterium]|nr:hypothetical protein [Fimbriimonadaceae bacterium]
MEKRSIRSLLTIRESDVLRLAVQGHTDRVIATKLKVKLPTVRTYWQRIRIKSGGLNRSQAMVAYVREVGVATDTAPQSISFGECFLALCGALPGTVCVTDLDGTIRFLSRAPISQPAEVWIGENIRTTIDPRGKEAVEEAIAMVRKTSAPWYFKSEVRIEDSLVPFANIASPIIHGGAVEGLLFFAVEFDGSSVDAERFGPFLARAIPAKG